MVALAALPARLARSVPPEAPDYARQIAPILTKYCVGCHGPQEASGELRLDSPAAIKKGAESGPVVTPPSLGKSPLITVLEEDADPRMPPEDSPQPAEHERELLRRWVLAGAPTGRGDAPRSLPPLRRLPKAATPSPITAVAYEPTRRLVAVGRFGQVTLRDLGGRSRVTEWSGLPGKVNDLAFSSDGRWLFAATGVTGVGGSLATWDVERGKPGPQLKGHDDIMLAVAVDARGQHIATTSYDRTVILWNWRERRPIRTIAGHHGAVFAAAFSPDGTILATASGDETVKLWQVPGGRRLDTMSQPQGEQYAVQFSPDGNLVAAGGADSRLRVWRVASRKGPAINPLVASLFAHERPIVALSFTADRSHIITAGEDRSVACWQVADWKEAARFGQLGGMPSDIVVTDDLELQVAMLDGRTRSFTLESVLADGEPSAVAGTSGTQPAALAQPKPSPSSSASSMAEQTEREPNDRLHSATKLAGPTRTKGRLFSDGSNADVDWFRFDAQRGSEWIVETFAARDGSPADTTIQVYDEQGRLIPRVMLQAVRDSYVTFRGIDSRSIDLRVHHWEEMDLNEYLYLNGEVVKLFLYPRGPDSGFQLYYRGGRRLTYFDTTSIAHALHEPCYIVEPVPVGTPARANGLPVFPIYYENDDDCRAEAKTDSRVTFTAPRDGTYYIKVFDARQLEGPDFRYELVLRAPAPDFVLSFHMAQPKVNAGSGKEFEIEIDRIDGFDGPVRVDVVGFPPAWHVTTPLVVESGQRFARGTVHTLASTPPLSDEERSRIRLRASAVIGGKPIRKEIAAFGKLERVGPPKLRVSLAPNEATPVPWKRSAHEADSHPFPPVHEIVLRPGETTAALLRADRSLGFSGRIQFESLKLNLPHGVYVDNIGLNGILIPEKDQQRTVFFTAAPWVAETTRWLYLRANQDGTQTTFPLRLRVVTKEGRSANR